MVLWHAPAPARASLVPASACCPLSPDGTARSLAPAAPAALVPRGQGTPLPHTQLLWSKIPLESAGNSLAWGLDSSLEGPACPNGFLGLCEVLGHRSVLAAGGPRAGGGLAGPAGTSRSATAGTAQPQPYPGCSGRAAPSSCPDLPPPARDVQKPVPGCCGASSGSSWPDAAISCGVQWRGRVLLAFVPAAPHRAVGRRAADLAGLCRATCG